jgi:superkiller protein 3
METKARSAENKIILVAALIILALTTAAFQRNRIWRHSVILWQDSTLKSPMKARAHYNLGLNLGLAGRTDEAIEHFQRAIELRPTSEAYNNLGSAYQTKGMYDRAVEQHFHALSLDPDNADAYYNLGRAYLISKTNNDYAVAMFKKAITLKSDFTNAYINLAAAYIQAKKFNDAVQVLEPVMLRSFNRPDAHFNLGVSYFYLGNTSAAQRELSILKKLDSQFADQLEKLVSQPRQGTKLLK